MKTSLSVVIVARNEEENIRPVLDHVTTNSLTNMEIVFVDDGSTDGTATIAREYTSNIVSLPQHKENHAGTPEMAKKFNAGLERAGYSDYVMILGADDILHDGYVDKILRRMEKDRSVAVASGQALGEKAKGDVPRGSGRVFRKSFLDSVGGRYPVCWAWEETPIYLAKARGYKTKVYPYIFFQRLRGGRSSQKARGDGRALYALGLPTLFVLGLCVKRFLTKPGWGVNVFTGWLTAKKNRVEKVEVLKPHMRSSLGWLKTFILNKLGISHDLPTMRHG